jgi:hypothetical protein
MKGTRIVLQNIITQYRNEHKLMMLSSDVEGLANRIADEFEAIARKESTIICAMP